MKDGFVKVAAAVPDVTVADTVSNTESIIACIAEAAKAGVKVLALPELCVTGYTCGDMFAQTALLDGALEGADKIIKATKGLEMFVAFGMPLVVRGKLYNCAFAVCDGELLGVVPKTYVPNYGELYEQRCFTAAPAEQLAVSVAGFEGVAFGTRQVFVCRQLPELRIGIEICDDLWAPSQPSIGLAKAGATIILNTAASAEIVGRDDYRCRLVREQSARLICGYVYADAGEGESTTDAVFAGHSLIAENGEILAQRKPFEGNGMTVSEIDVKKLAAERRRINIFDMTGGEGISENSFSLPLCDTTLTRRISASPFMPDDKQERSERCEHILNIQTYGLKKRLEHTHAKCAVVAVSGGLDSCLALLVTVRAMDKLGCDRSSIIAISMPGFGTTGRTRSNAQVLCEELGVSWREISINDAVRVHFRDIGHDETVQDVTYENSQARERTQIAMDIANKKGGMLIGTGDMSELALGWATYNGDHMSMYGVNASVPKTLVRHVVAHCAETAAQQGNSLLSDTLLDILATPVSPELLPAKENEIQQKTEDIVGPYELHDFFMYYILRYGIAPEKLFRMAKYAFAGEYDDATILKWQTTFTRRFFMQQFKRSCLPDGPKTGSAGLSPRGDLRMPSDASSRLWLERLENMRKML